MKKKRSFGKSKSFFASSARPRNGRASAHRSPYVANKTPPLGQHFLRGSWAARALVEAARISETDTAVEIGPGTGILTRELLAKGARVIAIEKDPPLVAELHKTFAAEIEQKKLELIPADIRDVSPEKLGLQSGAYTLAANIPYYITGEIIRMFLTAEIYPRTIALLVQKEVAQRIVSKKESILSLSVKAFGVPRVAAKVSRGNFSPPPSVDSAIIVIEHISKEFFDEIREEDFFKVVRMGFSSKRKLLAGNLSKEFGSKNEILAVFTECGIEEKARAEDVPLPKWKLLVKALVSGRRR